MKCLFFPALLLGGLMGQNVWADSVSVDSVKHLGPYVIQAPFMVDSLDANSKPFDGKGLLQSRISFEELNGAPVIALDDLAANDSTRYALNVLSFAVSNAVYSEVKLVADDLDCMTVYLDGVKQADKILKLEPANHTVAIKYVSGPNIKSQCKSMSLKILKGGPVTCTSESADRVLTIHDVMDGKRVSSVKVSPNGKSMIVAIKDTKSGGKTIRSYEVRDIATNKVIATSAERLSWMPRSNAYYYTKYTDAQYEMYIVNIDTKEHTMIDGIPGSISMMSPNEDYFICSMRTEGPKERKEIYEILEPDDRQPGWRDRYNLAKYDLKTGVLQPLTFGYESAYVSDISADGKYMLFQTSRSRLTARPTTVFTLYRMNLETLETETLVKDDGFLNSAIFSPDGKKVLIQGSPECLNGVGMMVKEGQTPSMMDNQLYMMDVATRAIEPLTRLFNPSVLSYSWSKSDNKVYFTAENRDYVSLYQLNPDNKSIAQLDAKEERIVSFHLSAASPVMAYYGNSASNSDRLYVFDNLKKPKAKLMADYSAEKLKDIELGACNEWDFVNSQGDTIYGRYYLPPHFDATKKYPMIVNYYGGCSPTSRYFESNYPQHVYAALGYVVYVVEPSGATGFGQEFSARHVNTAGERVADDIIEGVKKFAAEHDYINTSKIGCIGASYGGFMTQYLQTKTDIFAAAISHAGISDHTSYWGEGYWGYSYSEVSMANSYPWKNPDLFVKQSPLYNADKIHTPLLFLHGSSDTNVPVGESIQMYTALKLLGRETAFVMVDGEGHHIIDYDKHLKWQNTIFAWFAKWLQDDPSWWNALYSPKTL